MAYCNQKPSGHAVWTGLLSLHSVLSPLALSLSQALAICIQDSLGKHTLNWPCVHCAGSGVISAATEWELVAHKQCFSSRPRCLYGICSGLAGQREPFQRSPRTPVRRHWAERAKRIGRRNVSSATCQPSAPGTSEVTYQRTLLRVTA